VTGKLSARQRTLATVGVMLALFLAALDQSVVGPAMPRIAAELNGVSLYSWVATAYMVANALMVPIAGKLGDMFGRKPFLLTGMLGFMAFSWLSGFSQNMPELIAFRGVQGLFGGMLFASTFTVIADLFTIEERTRIQGLFGGVFGLSSVVGPTAGGWLTDHWGWRWVFYVNVPVGVLAVIAVFAFLPYVRSKASWREIDYVGVVALAAGLVPMLLGLSLTSDHAWTSPAVLVPLIAGGAFLIAFFVVETRWAKNPIVPFDLFRRNQFAVMIIVAFFSAFGMFAAMIYAPLLYQGVLSVSATNSGSFMVPMVAMLLVFSVVSGQVVLRVRRYRFMAAFGLAAVIAGMWVLTTVTPDSSQLLATAGLMIMGAGLGITFPLTNSVVQASLPRSVVGVGTSQVQFWRSVGGTVGLAILGSIMAQRLPGAIESRISALHLPPQFRLPSGLSGGSAQTALDPANLARIKATLPAQVQPLFDQVVHAMRFGIADTLHVVFMLGAGIVLIALVASLFLREVPVPQPVVDMVTTQLNNYLATRPPVPGVSGNGHANGNGALPEGWRPAAPGGEGAGDGRRGVL
jgi:EmrB/QacA subfamily drug resistance transporter